MGYFEELRRQWRPLLAALIGLGSGFSAASYVTSIMAPHFIKEFGWSKAEFALVGGLGLISTAVFPFIGRLTDVIGVRRTALIGVIAAPLSFLILSRISGDIRLYIAVFLFQGAFCVTTTATVYSRIVVQYITRARGLALAIVASAPALTGAFGAPLLNDFVEAHGWRAGYVVVAIFALTAGAIALLIMPPERKAEPTPGMTRRQATRSDYREIFRTKAFWLLIAAMLLCNLSQVISLTQLNLALLAQGVTPKGVSGMISMFASGVLVGRFLSGIALDRFPAPFVAAIGLSLPSIGLFLMGFHCGPGPLLGLSVLLLGLSLGAEGDVIAYLVVRNFGVRIYGSVMGMVTATTSISASLGAALLSLTLKLTGGFDLFLLACGATALVGAMLFLFLPRQAVVVS